MRRRRPHGEQNREREDTEDRPRAADGGIGHDLEEMRHEAEGLGDVATRGFGRAVLAIGVHGPDARVHYEYHARHLSPAFVGEELVVTGRILDRYEKRGRVYLQYRMEVHTADGRLVTEYTDRTVLKYLPGALT